MPSRLMIRLVLPLVGASVLAAVSLQRGTANAQQRPDVPPAATADGEAPGAPTIPFPRLPDTGPDAPNAPNVTTVGFNYLKLIGTAFRNRDSASTYDYSSNGCMYQTAGTDPRFQVPLILPEDSVIQYVRIYYLDTSASNMTVWLSRYEPGQSSTDVTSVVSAGATGYGTALSPLIHEQVDMATYAYVLTWGPGVSSSANQICGVRIAYYKPFSIDPEPNFMITALQVQELRVRISAALGFYNVMTSPTYTNGMIIGTTIVKAIDVAQTRAGIDMAYAAAGLSNPTYTNPPPVTGSEMRATDLIEMREKITALGF